MVAAPICGVSDMLGFISDRSGLNSPLNNLDIAFLSLVHVNGTPLTFGNETDFFLKRNRRLKSTKSTLNLA